MPKKFLSAWTKNLTNDLIAKKVKNYKKIKKNNVMIVVVFLNPKAAQEVNKKFRGRDYPTDILSFADGSNGSGDGESLGELVICPQVIKRQAKAHRLSFKTELGYMLTHGVLHLLGYDHEQSKKAEKQMMKIQEAAFLQVLQKCSLTDH